MYAPHARNDPAGGYIFPRVDLMPSESRQLQERASHVGEGGDSTDSSQSEIFLWPLTTYSRGSILPLAMCFSRALGEPPS